MTSHRRLTYLCVLLSFPRINAVYERERSLPKAPARLLRVRLGQVVQITVPVTSHTSDERGVPSTSRSGVGWIPGDGALGLGPASDAVWAIWMIWKKSHFCSFSFGGVRVMTMAVV